MKYTREQVKKIIEHHSKDLNGDKMIDNWMNNESNKPLSLSKYDYPLFCYTFPIMVDNKLEAEVSLLGLAGSGLDDVGRYANKYLGNEIYDSSWISFCYDSYKHAYLFINKNLKLPTSHFSEYFYFYEGTFKDASDKDIKYKIYYGQYDYDDHYECSEALKAIESRGYSEYYFDNNVTLLIEDIEIDGNLLGEEINKRIKKRK